MQTELSQNLQQLSEKARTTTEFIQRLKQMSEKLNVSHAMYKIIELNVINRAANTGRVVEKRRRGSVTSRKIFWRLRKSGHLYMA